MSRSVGRMAATLTAAHGLNHTEVAARIGVHRNTYAEKLAGRRPFTEDEILALATLFGVEPGRLFDDPQQLLGVTAPSRCTEVPWGRTLLRLVS